MGCGSTGDEPDRMDLESAVTSSWPVARTNSWRLDTCWRLWTGVTRPGTGTTTLSRTRARPWVVPSTRVSFILTAAST